MRDIVIFVMALPPGAVEQLQASEKKVGKKLQPLVLLDSRSKKTEFKKFPDEVIVVTCDFSKSEKIAEALLPYQKRILAITCRSEKSLARFAQVLPHVPYVRTPSTESLAWASDKYEMRKRFALYDKKITPRFTLVSRNSAEERERVVKKIGFPLVVKPTNLAGSLFVSICYHEEEFESTLRTIFRKLKQAYKKDERLELPKVIAEEYMEGDLYSIDSYVDSRGKVYHCPLVKQSTAKQHGHDDLFNYLQITPTTLKRNTVSNAEDVAVTAIHAIGLRSTVVHTELMKVEDDWKVVEVGARMGGFRHLLYELSCGINHTLNDVLIRIPKKPLIPKKCTGYSCAIKGYVKKEGIIREMKGLKKIEQLDSFHELKTFKKIGDRATFAKNGGRAVFHLFMHNSDRSKLLADIRRVEKLVSISTARK